MAAPKTRKVKDVANAKRKRVQIIVFAPNDPMVDPDENQSYMICPPSLRVLEVIEKFDDEAEKYLDLLQSKKNAKTTRKTSHFVGEDFDDGADDVEIQISGAMSPKAGVGKRRDSVEAIEEAAVDSLGLDSDIVAFASELDDIFPEDATDYGTGSDDGGSENNVDLEDALALLDESSDGEDVEALANAMMGDDDSLPSL